MCKPLPRAIKHRDSAYLTNIVPPGQDLSISHQILHHFLVVPLHGLQNDKCVLLLLLWFLLFKITMGQSNWYYLYQWTEKNLNKSSRKTVVFSDKKAKVISETWHLHWTLTRYNFLLFVFCCLLAHCVFRGMLSSQLLPCYSSGDRVAELSNIFSAIFGNFWQRWLLPIQHSGLIQVKFSLFSNTTGRTGTDDRLRN